MSENVRNTKRPREVEHEKDGVRERVREKSSRQGGATADEAVTYVVEEITEP